MVKCGVLFEVRTGFLNIIGTSFGFKWLIGIENNNVMTGYFVPDPQLHVV
jgi:hypothetical protein